MHPGAFIIVCDMGILLENHFPASICSYESIDFKVISNQNFNFLEIFSYKTKRVSIFVDSLYDEHKSRMEYQRPNKSSVT